MGMNLIVAQKLWELYNDGELKDCKSVLELGPHGLGAVARQDIYARFATERFGDCDKVRKFKADGYDENGNIRSMAQRDFYRLFGFDEYRSIDLSDDNADYRLNLNDPIKLDRKFDMIADYGTSEHLFNIGQAFASTYNLLRPGGIAYYQLPVMGLIHHGLYNIHTELYYSLAAAGYYEIIKMDYFHALQTYFTAGSRKAKRLEDNLDIPAGHDIRQGDARHMTLGFYAADIWQALRGKDRTSATVIVALKKIDDKPFVFPQQSSKTWGF
jgi:hypothetical protein